MSERPVVVDRAQQWGIAIARGHFCKEKETCVNARQAMHLVALTAENFRIFGPKETGRHLHLEVKRGLTVLVGENDAGKSAAMDALRLALGSKGQD